MAAKSTITTALDILIDASRVEAVLVCVLAGDDGFLQHEARRALVAQWGDAAGDGGGADVLDGERAELREIFDLLSELSLFGSERRLVVVTEADALVKEHRAQLEDYVARPAKDATLILEVESWPSNTRLAKAVAESGLTVKCEVPQNGAEVGAFQRRLLEWLAVSAKRDFQCEMVRGAGEQLIELLPTEAGILYQEVGRLSLLAGSGGKFDAALVREHVGGWRTRKTWDMIDAAADGRAADALQQLDRLLSAGEEPHALLPQMASTLRRFASAVRQIEEAERRGQRLSLREALQRAGVLPFKLGDGERQLRQIGRPRARRLFRWLLAADLELKGYNSTKERARRVIETLIMRLSREAHAPGAIAASNRTLRQPSG